ncbi:hypothetical protein [Pseudovibrio sp. Tun.PSC04-5.I4]|uniref:hypothetical protein n=1 Tax=Pseudovibrio sp. Tun.PSC04-5.I4 TaxID=1798213 RepID=UPI00088067B7|nr:hypothetical protein [Pseudovibrio sp. Tun.PSC04-5.I4]SDQ99656.1 hypothetical protein SAMN04515695_2232 [Pseudovibrio sp. Tun.PSC04-5.I4]
MAKLKFVAAAQLQTSKGTFEPGKKLPANFPKRELEELEKLGGVIQVEVDETDNEKAPPPPDEPESGDGASKGNSDP